MKLFRRVVYGPVLVICSLYFSVAIYAQNEPQKSQCFICHSSPKKLIEITRQLAKERKDYQAKSAMIKGEG